MSTSATGGRPAGRMGGSRESRPWTPDTVPQELIDILDEHAGRRHSRTGSVVSALAEILTAYDRRSFRS